MSETKFTSDPSTIPFMTLVEEEEDEEEKELGLVEEEVKSPTKKDKRSFSSDPTTIPKFEKVEPATKVTSSGGFTSDPTTLPTLRTVDTPKGVISVDSALAKYEGKPLIKEDFLEDTELQELVYKSLEARGRDNPNLMQKGRGALTRLFGGADIANYKDNIREADFEDVFETWQQWQRSLSAGHSVTVGNELAYVLSSDDRTKAGLAAGYTLFDNMDNAFTGEGSWKEMADAIWDYGKSAVVDPVNLVTFGIGKGLAAVGTKGGVATLKEVVKAAGTKWAGDSALKKGAVSASLKAAPFMAPELVVNVGSDAIEQYIKIDTGSQEDFQYSQSAAAAAGTILLPAVIGGVTGMGKLRKSKVFKGSAFDTPDLSVEKALSLSEEDAWKLLNETVDKDVVNKAVRKNFGTVKGESEKFGVISGTKNKFKTWEKAKDWASTLETPKTKDDAINAFEQNFWIGSVIDEEGKRSGGFLEALDSAGFRITDNMRNGKGGVSSQLGQAIRFLRDDTVNEIVKDFEKEIGMELGLGYTSDMLAMNFIKRSESLGKGLGLRGEMSRLVKIGFDEDQAKKLATGMAESADVDDPKVMQFLLSTYKRTLTSHLSTTGANVQGFAQLVSLDTLGDLFASVAYTGQKLFYEKVKKNPELAAEYAKKSFGSRRAVANRIGGILSPDTQLDFYEDIIEAFPEKISSKINEKVFRDIAGDGGVRDALTDYNLGNSTWAQAVDKVTRLAQSASGVRLQDDITKRWAFGTNLTRSIEKKFGVSATDFFADPKNAFVMETKEFDFVIEEAIFRTLKETASINWTLLPAKGAMRAAAKMYEGFTNRSLGGFVVPFGSFQNTSIAIMSDLSGINLIRRIAGAARGQKLDYATEDAGELIGKTAAGLSAIGFAIPGAFDKIQEGLSWNQQKNDDGSVDDNTFVWPDSFIQIFASIFAHGVVKEEGKSFNDLLTSGDFKWSKEEVPSELLAEFGNMTAGQSMRDVEGFFDDVKKTFSDVAENPFELSTYMKAIGTVVSRPVQGYTRPLDPVNTVAGMLRGNGMNPDLRQGARTWNEMTKYINHILPEGVPGSAKGMPQRNDSLTGARKGTDIGKQILGARQTTYPNLPEALFNSAGIDSWREVKWSGPPEVKNVMDSLASSYFQMEAKRQLKTHPDFFTVSKQKRQAIVRAMIKNVKKRVLDTLDNSLPNSLNMVRLISGNKDAKVRRVMDKLGFGDMELVDFLEEDDGLEQLTKIKYFVDNYDDTFLSGID